LWSAVFFLSIEISLNILYYSFKIGFSLSNKILKFLFLLGGYDGLNLLQTVEKYGKKY